MSTGQYLDQLIPRLEKLRSQSEAIERAAALCADAIGGDGVVHVFGAGHSRMMAEEAYPRIGAVAGFRPVVELAVTFFHDVVGPNGLEQALFLERAPGYGTVIFNELAARPGDATIVFSSSGVEAIIMDYVDAAQSAGIKVIGVTSFEYSAQTSAERRWRGDSQTSPTSPSTTVSRSATPSSRCPASTRRYRPAPRSSTSR